MDSVAVFQIGYITFVSYIFEDLLLSEHDVFLLLFKNKAIHAYLIN